LGTANRFAGVILFANPRFWRNELICENADESMCQASRIGRRLALFAAGCGSELAEQSQRGILAERNTPKISNRTNALRWALTARGICTPILAKQFPAKTTTKSTNRNHPDRRPPAHFRSRPIMSAQCGRSI